MTVVTFLPAAAFASDLEDVRQLVQDSGQVQETNDLGLDLSGLNFSWEVAPAVDRRVLAISRNLGGVLLSFDPDGRLVSRTETREISSMQLCDLDEDGVAEILTEEVTGRGTGILQKEWRLYRLEGTRLGEVWHQRSFDRKQQRESGGDLVSETLRTYVRCEPSGGGETHARLILAEEEPGSQRVTFRAFTIVEGRLTELPN